MSNFKSLAKRKRELAKQDKRQAKDQKRALRKAERSGANSAAPVAIAVAAAAPTVAKHRPGSLVTAPAPTPLTLAQAVERWKNTKVVKPKNR